MSGDEDRFTWTAENYNIRDFLREYSRHLPAVMQITVGWHSVDGMQDFGNGDMYRICSTATQKRVLTITPTGQCLGIPLDYDTQFNVKRRYENSPSKVSPLLSMREIVDQHMMTTDVDLVIYRDKQHPLKKLEYLDEEDTLRSIRFTELVLDHCYEERYLLGNTITDGKVVPYIDDQMYQDEYFSTSKHGMVVPVSALGVVSLPTYMPVRVAVATGLSEGSDRDYRRLLDSYAETVKPWNITQAKFNKEILMYNEYVPGGDYEYIIPGTLGIPSQHSHEEQQDVMKTGPGARQLRLPAVPPAKVAAPTGMYEDVNQSSSRPTPTGDNNSVAMPSLPPPRPPRVNSTVIVSTAESRRVPPNPYERDVSKISSRALVESNERTLQESSNRNSSRPLPKPPVGNPTRPLPKPPVGNPTMPLPESPVGNPSRPLHRGNPSNLKVASVKPMISPSHLPTDRPDPKPHDGGCSKADGSWQPVGQSSVPLEPMDLSTVPKDISGLTVSELAACMQALNMGKYSAAFHKNTIDGAFLSSVDEEQKLMVMMVDFFGMEGLEAHKLWRFAHNGWRPTL